MNQACVLSSLFSALNTVIVCCMRIPFICGVLLEQAALRGQCYWAADYPAVHPASLQGQNINTE